MIAHRTDTKSTHSRIGELGLALALSASCALPACANTTHDQSVALADVRTERLEFANTHIVRARDASGEPFSFVVDPGYETRVDSVVAAARAVGIERLDLIILSHGHSDHAAAAPLLKEQLGGVIVAGAGDREMLLAGANDMLCPTNRRACRRQEEDQAHAFTPFDADVYVDGPVTLAELTGRDVEGDITLLPGHTAGSIVVRLGDAAFVGDLLRGSVTGSDAERHYYICDLDDNERDIRGFREDNPDVRWFFTGHFGPVDESDVDEWIDEHS